MIVMLAAAALAGTMTYYSPGFAIFAALISSAVFFFYSPKTAAIFLGASTIFFMNASLHSLLAASSLTGQETGLTIRFSELPSINGAVFRAVGMMENGEKLLVHHKLKTASEKEYIQENFKLGTVCVLKGKLEKPEAARNENAFDYSAYLQKQNIYWIFKSRGSPFSNCEEQPRTIGEFTKTLRQIGLGHIEGNFPPESAGFASALLFGEADGINPDVYEDYTKLSLVHILAISGLHVAIISTFLLYGFIRAGLTRETANTAIICLLPVYMVLAGGAPSIIRSGLMVIVFLALSMMKIRFSSIFLICSVFIGMLLLNPLSLLQPGFQLSFYITFALLTSKSLLSGPLSGLKQSLSVAVICHLYSIPIVLTHFHEISIWGFVLNILYVPLYSFLLLPLSFICFLLSLWNLPLSEFFFFVLELSFRLANHAAAWIAGLPFASLSFGSPPEWFSYLLAAIIVTGFVFLEKKNRNMVIASFLLFVTVMGLFYHKERMSPVGEVIFIDIGQGDSILIKAPFGGPVYLIDTGGVLPFAEEEWSKRKEPFEPGKDILVPFLKSKGIHTIDKLILTHDDHDHIGGANAVMEYLNVKEIMLPQALRANFADSPVREGAETWDIPVTFVEAGFAWSQQEAVFAVLHPDVYTESSNESSLVLYAELGGKSWLFTGDLGESGERLLLEAYPGLQADILKVGHHGSKHSSTMEFLKQIDAEAAVISAGADNRYGHPHPDVLKRLEEAGIEEVYRTDEMGAVSYTYFYRRSGTFSAALP